VDGSPASAAAVRLGFAYARRHNLPVAAVHVDDHRPGDFWFDDRFLETHFAAEPAALALLARDVEPVAARFRHVPVKRAVYGGETVTGPRRHRRCSARARTARSPAACTVAPRLGEPGIRGAGGLCGGRGPRRHPHALNAAVPSVIL
jgi:hypothetical protein